MDGVLVAVGAAVMVTCADELKVCGAEFAVVDDWPAGAGIT
jgi:hypothetical protein